MPIKRRLGKSRDLDIVMIKEHFYGPGSSLLAGCGYFLGDFYWNLDEAGQEEVVEQMREDWERHSATILAAWDARSEHDLYLWREYHAACPRPWSETQFGSANHANAKETK